MVAGTFIREQTMSNIDAEPKPCELNEEELDRVSGSGEEVHFEYGALQVHYVQQQH
jgi:hypothetical protein